MNLSSNSLEPGRCGVERNCFSRAGFHFENQSISHRFTTSLSNQSDVGSSTTPRHPFQIHALEVGLMNFAKAVEGYSNLLDIHRPSLNGYIMDAILSSPICYRIWHDFSSPLADDWDRDRGQFRSPQISFVQANKIDETQTVDIKIYVNLSASADEKYQQFTASCKRIFRQKCVPTLFVSELIDNCLSVPNVCPGNGLIASKLCFRILGRSDILHPHARLGDHEYIRNCIRVGSTPRLLLETFDTQESFLPTIEDKKTPLCLHEAYAMESLIVSKQKIVNSMSMMKFAELEEKIRSLSSKGQLKEVTNSYKSLENNISNHVSTICDGLKIGSRVEAWEDFDKSFRDLVEDIVIDCRGTKTDFDKVQVLRNLAILEMQVIRQTVAFLKWKQAWYPDLQFSIDRLLQSTDSLQQCERELGFHISDRRAVHRTSKCEIPFTVRIRGIVDPTTATETSKKKAASYYRVNVVLTYAGHPLSYVCPPASKRHVTVNGVTSVLCDYHFTRKVDSQKRIDEYIQFSGFPFRRLPRETLLNISYIALKKSTEEPNVLNEGKLLGWVNVPIFDSNGELRQEFVLAGLWPANAAEALLPEQRLTFSEPNRDPSALVVELEFPIYEAGLTFTKPPILDYNNLNLSKGCPKMTPEPDFYQFCSTNHESFKTRHLPSPYNKWNFTAFSRPLCDLSKQRDVVGHLWNSEEPLTRPECLITLLVMAPVCWLTQSPAPSSMVAHDETLWMWLLSNLYSRIHLSNPLPPAAALRLLLPDVADQFIRHWAVCCISQLPPDALIFLLPSLLEAVNYDLHMDWSGLVSLLLHRSVVSVRFCNALYWNIECLVANTKRLNPRRLIILKTALCWLRGSQMKVTWALQTTILKWIVQIGKSVKSAKAELRRKLLGDSLTEMQCYLDTLCPSASSPCQPSFPKTPCTPRPDAFRFPYDFGFASRKLDIAGCAYITSSNCPINISFTGIDASSANTIFKEGVDLQMDLLICQLIHLADQIWLDGELDLCIPQFTVLPTQPLQGLIEVVHNSQTLREVKGSPTSPPEYLLTWLKRNQKTDDALQKAIQNFACSTVAGSVLTFVLGLGDRHNDNVMVCENGQSFHIDFSKVLGDFQKVGAINRDSSPFVLTRELQIVVKAAEPGPHSSNKISDPAQIPEFVRKYTLAYNLLRKNTLSFMGILEMAWQMQIPGLERCQVKYVHQMLHDERLKKNPDEFYSQSILESMNSITQVTSDCIHATIQALKQRGQPNIGVKPATEYVSEGVYLSVYGGVEDCKANAEAPSTLPLVRRIAIQEPEGLYSVPLFTFQILVNTDCPEEVIYIRWQAQQLKELANHLREHFPHDDQQAVLLNQVEKLCTNASDCPQPSLLLENLAKLLQSSPARELAAGFLSPTKSDPKRPLSHCPSDLPAVELALDPVDSSNHLCVSVIAVRNWWLSSENLSSTAMMSLRILSRTSLPTPPQQKHIANSPGSTQLPQHFVMDIPPNDWKTGSLVFSAYQLGLASNVRHFIGAAYIPLHSLLVNGQLATQWYVLSRQSFVRV